VLDVLNYAQNYAGPEPYPSTIAGIGPQMIALQDEWAKYVGTKHCLVTNSGTAALHMTVAATGVGPGDEVITSAFTFLASASCVLHHNGIPVFVDIDSRTFTMDPKKIEEKIAKKHNLAVIEDACQAHGAKYKGRKVGTLGDMAAFSLNSTKNLQAADAGLFNTDRDDYRDLAARVRMFGEDVKPGESRKYDATVMGWQYRPHELTCALARSQLRRLDERNSLRTKNCEYLSENLSKIDGVQPPFVPPYAQPVY